MHVGFGPASEPTLKMALCQICMSVGPRCYRFSIECRRCEGQEFESDNDLPYRHHKRACHCLMCVALMQGEN